MEEQPIVEVIPEHFTMSRKRRYKKTRQGTTKSLRPTKRSRSNLIRSKRVNRVRSNIGLSKLDYYRLIENAEAIQYLDMSTPSWSRIYPLSVIATGAGVDQRGNDLTPKLLGCTFHYIFKQPVTTVFKYKIIGFTILDRSVTTAPPLPSVIFTAHPSTTNFQASYYLMEQARTLQFHVWYDKFFIVDTTSGHNSLKTHIKVRVPPVTPVYALADATGATAKNHQYIAILTDATNTSVSHLFDYWYSRMFNHD